MKERSAHGAAFSTSPSQILESLCTKSSLYVLHRIIVPSTLHSDVQEHRNSQTKRAAGGLTRIVALYFVGSQSIWSSQQRGLATACGPETESLPRMPKFDISSSTDHRRCATGRSFYSTTCLEPPSLADGYSRPKEVTVFRLSWAAVYRLTRKLEPCQQNTN